MKRIIFCILLTASLCLAVSFVPDLFPKFLPSADAVAVTDPASTCTLPASAVTARGTVFLFEDGKAVEQRIWFSRDRDGTIRLLGGIRLPAWILIGDALSDGEYVVIKSKGAASH